MVDLEAARHIRCQNVRLFDGDIPSSERGKESSLSVAPNSRGCYECDRLLSIMGCVLGWAPSFRVEGVLATD